MLSLYIHVPYCVGKCRYCGFYSTVYRSDTADSFLQLLAREINLHESLLRERPIGTLYIGGGTPTVLSTAQLQRLFDSIGGTVPLSGLQEITIEANPGTVNAEKLSALIRCGVSRISIGAQSFSDELLASLGRRHKADASIAAVHASRDAGFRNIGLDLIYGIPGQSQEQWLHTLETAVELEPEHLSIYALSLDEGAQMHLDAASGLVTMPDDETAAAQYEAAADLLGRHGYGLYEISNFCVPGKECMHNSNYWKRGEYLGLGPGAWSFLGRTRSRSVADVDEYRSRIDGGLPLAVFEETLLPIQEAEEMIALGLRTAQGIDVERYASFAGQEAADALLRSVNELEWSGMFRIEGNRITLTKKGMVLSNEAISRVMP